VQYMLLIYTPEDDHGQTTEAEAAALVDRYRDVMRDQKARGKFVDALRLNDRKPPTTVRIERGGGTQLTDGPFVETKEILAGFIMLECATREEAVAEAAKIPGAEVGTVEVRGVVDLPALLGRA